MPGPRRRGWPSPVLPWQHVGEEQQPPRGGGDRHLERFPRLSEPAVEGREIPDPAHRDHGRHVEGIPDGDPATTDHLPPANGAGIPVPRRDTRQGDDLVGVRPPQRLHLRQQPGRRGRPDAGKRGQDRVAPRDRRPGSYGLEQRGIEGIAPSPAQRDPFIELVLDEVQNCLRAPVLQCPAHIDHLAPGDDALGDPRHRLERRLRRRGLHDGRGLCEDFRVDLVRLGELTQDIGEAPGAVRVDDGNRNACLVPAGRGRAVVASGCFQHDQARRRRQTANSQFLQPRRIVANPEPVPGGCRQTSRDALLTSMPATAVSGCS